MSEHTATIRWNRAGAAFIDGRYGRSHAWEFDGGVTVPASASPHVVPVPLSEAAAVDPEEAFVAAVASCHMLWFLSIAAKAGYLAESYDDAAVGELLPSRRGKLAMTRITLRPRVAFAPDRRPAPAEHLTMHEQAHESCFLARSVRTELLCDPVDSTA